MVNNCPVQDKNAVINELKECELEILKAFVNVCSKLNLRYYLVEGTLLGAIRHQGFIPWDDDIDVGMLRKDYDRFIAEGQALLPSHLFIQTNETDPEYTFCFAKIRNSKTTNIETSLKNCRINHGVWIDIFPLDFYPEGRLQRFVDIFIKKCLTLRIRDDIGELKVTGIRAVPRKFLISLIRLIHPTLSQTIKCRDKLYGRHKHSSLIMNYGSIYEEREIVPYEWFGQGIQVDFAGIKANAPIEYDKWLTKIYGDYMTPPPQEKRSYPHYASVIDLNKPYTHYIKNKENEV